MGILNFSKTLLFWCYIPLVLPLVANSNGNELNFRMTHASNSMDYKGKLCGWLRYRYTWSDETIRNHVCSFADLSQLLQ